MDANEQKGTWLQLRVAVDLKDDLKRVAELKGLSVSGLLHSIIVKIIHEAKTEHPEAFGLRDIGDSEIREILYEGFSGEPIDLEVLRKAIDLIKITKTEPSERERKIKQAENYLSTLERQGKVVTESDWMQARQSPEQILQRPRVAKAIREIRKGKHEKDYKKKTGGS